MKSYWRLKNWGGLFLGLMLFVGYAALPLPGNEIFPFYSWSMFSLVPAQQNAYAVFIIGADKREEFQQATFGVSGAKNSVVAYKLIQNLGRAYEAGNLSKWQQLKLVFEKNYLAVGTRYELVRMNYDPLTRWRGQGREFVPLEQWVREP